ncbi:Olfactory Receptor 8S1, partial [Manis pentadactyla]
MACDRCAAICHPLLYGQVMRKQLGVQLMRGSWVLGFLNALINILLAANLDFYENHAICHYS